MQRCCFLNDLLDFSIVFWLSWASILREGAGVIRPIRGSSHIVYVYLHLVSPSDESRRQLRVLDSRLSVCGQSTSSRRVVRLADGRSCRRYYCLINYGSLPVCLFSLRSRNTSLPLTSCSLGDWGLAPSVTK